MAAGDVLVTIKAKYESLNKAVDQLELTGSLIKSINKQKIQIQGLKEVLGDAKSINTELKTVQQTWGRTFSGQKATGIRLLATSFTGLSKQMQKAREVMANTSSDAVRGANAITLVAGAYKQLNLQAKAYREVAKKLFVPKGGAWSEELREYKGKHPSQRRGRRGGFRPQRPYTVPEPIWDPEDPAIKAKTTAREFRKYIKKEEGEDPSGSWQQYQKDRAKFNKEEKARIAEQLETEKKFWQQKHDIWESNSRKWAEKENARMDSYERRVKAHTDAIARYREKEEKRAAALRKGGRMTDTEYLGRFKEEMMKMQKLARPPLTGEAAKKELHVPTLNQIQTALQKVNLLQGDVVEDSEQANLLLETRLKLQEAEVRMQKKLRGEVEKTTEARKGFMSGPFVPKTSDPAPITAQQKIIDRSIYRPGTTTRTGKDLDPTARDWNIGLRRNPGQAASMYDMATKLQTGMRSLIEAVGPLKGWTQEQIKINQDAIKLDDILRDLSFEGGIQKGWETDPAKIPPGQKRIRGRGYLTTRGRRIGPSRTAGVPGELAKLLDFKDTEFPDYRNLITDPQNRFGRAVTQLEDRGMDPFKIGDKKKSVSYTYDDTIKMLNKFKASVAQSTQAINKEKQARLGPGAGAEASGPMQGPLDTRYKQFERSPTTGRWMMRKYNLNERFQRRYGAGFGGIGDGGGGPRGPFGFGGQSGMPGKGWRNFARGARRNLGSKAGQNYLLGGGFPMLFGGGAGAVGGSLLGSGFADAIGMSSAGFGLQIAGSAIGTAIETSIRKTNELANALGTLSMDSLIQSGIKFKGVLQDQINLLLDQGKYQEARKKIEEEIFWQTGASAEVFEAVNNSVNFISSAWGEFVNSGGVLLSSVMSPLLVVLGAILKMVNQILWLANNFITFFHKGVKTLMSLLGDDINNAISEGMNTLNGGLQTAIAQARELGRQMEKAAGNLRYETNLKSWRNLGRTAEERSLNLTTDFNLENKAFTKEKDDAWKQILKDNRALFGNSITGASEKYKARQKFNLLWEQKERAKNQDQDFRRKRFAYDEGLKGLKDRNALAGSSRGYKMDIDLLNLQREGQGVFALGNEQEQKRLQLTEQKQKLEDKTLELQFKLGPKYQEQNEYKEHMIELKRKELELNYLQSDEQIRINDLYKQIADTIETGIVDSITAAVEGTKTLGEVAANVFRSIARMLMQYGVSTGLNALMPNLGVKKVNQINYNNTVPPNSMGSGGVGETSFDLARHTRAAGGPVTGGRPYLVGEEGPELFVPGASGGIVANNSLGGGTNIVVNVDASGTNAESDGDQQRQLGNLIGAAVQAEIVRQQRPGGLLQGVR